MTKDDYDSPEIRSSRTFALFLFNPSEQQAIVIDPQRDISVYPEFAAAKGLSITHILEALRVRLTSAGGDHWRQVLP